MLKRSLMVLSGLAMMTAGIGATSEGRARVRIARDFPVQGRLIEVEHGRRLQLDCRGKGSPTVLLESGLDHLGSLGWAAIHDSIALDARVCAYSRAGILWSDPAPAPFDATRATHDLHTALLRAGEAPPWVVVGHSIGGVYATLFTAAYPREVTGIVLVDATHPLQMPRLAEALGESPLPSPALLTAGVALAPALSRTGVTRLLADPSAPTWPPAVRAAADAYFPRSVRAVLMELRAIDATLAAANRRLSLGSRPLVVLTAIDSPDSATAARAGLTQEQASRKRATWKSLQEEEASWSSDTRHELVHHTSHHIQIDRPEVVIAAIRDVLARARR